MLFCVKIDVSEAIDFNKKKKTNRVNVLFVIITFLK